MTAINAALLLSLKSSTCRLGRGQAPYAHEDARPHADPQPREPTREAATAAFAKSWRRE